MRRRIAWKTSYPPDEAAALVASPVEAEANAVGGYLRRRGLKVGLARTGAEAEPYVRTAPLQIAVIDLRLRAPSGLELAAICRARQARLPVVVIHEEPVGALSQRLAELAVETIASPFQMTTMRECVAMAIARVRETGTETEAERRRHARANLVLPVSVIGPDGREAPGTARDVSLGGMRVRVRSSEAVSPPQQVRVVLRLPCEHVLLTLAAEVLRVYPGGEWALLILPPPLVEKAHYFNFVARCLYNNRYGVLFADGDPKSCKLARGALRAVGYGLYVARRLVRVQKLLERERVDALVTDIVLPDGETLPVVRAARERYPDLVVGLTASAESVLPEVEVPVLSKPWTAGELRDWIERLLRSRSESKEESPNG